MNHNIPGVSGDKPQEPIIAEHLTEVLVFAQIVSVAIGTSYEDRCAKRL